MVSGRTGLLELHSLVGVLPEPRPQGALGAVLQHDAAELAIVPVEGEGPEALDDLRVGQVVQGLDLQGVRHGLVYLQLTNLRGKRGSDRGRETGVGVGADRTRPDDTGY